MQSPKMVVTRYDHSVYFFQVKIGVSASGLYVYQGRLRMETFKWPRMLKISYKTNIFHIKVRPAEVGLTMLPENINKVLQRNCQVLRLCQDVWAEGCENLFHFFLCDLVNQSPYGHDHWVRHIAIQIQLKSVNVCIYRNFACCVCTLCVSRGMVGYPRRNCRASSEFNSHEKL